MLTGKLLLHASCMVLALLTCSEGHANEFKVLTRAEPVVRMVLQEANNEPFAGMVAVAGVALDRVQDPRWPDTKKDVIYQRHQFTGMSVRFRNYRRDQITRARIAVATAEVGVRPCGTVLYYHHEDVKPEWDYTKIEVACQLGEHVFYRDKEN